MSESRDLIAARAYLAKAEADIMTDEGLARLQEGLALLESVIDDPASGHSAVVAGNVGSTYAAKLYERVLHRLEAHRNLPEPELKHLFAVLRAFDGAGFDTPPVARSLKIELVKRLVDLYYEGYSPEEKRKALEQLAGLARSDGEEGGAR